jgi:hypothetical protein
MLPKPYEILLKQLKISNFDEIYRLNEGLAIEAKEKQIEENRRLHLNLAPLPLLNRGLKIIETELELITYFYVYSLIHAKKLRFLFDQYLHDLNERLAINQNQMQKITIIDWGCGQGIGSQLLMEALLDSSKTKLKFKPNLVCIEPSHLALNRAVLHLSHFCELRSIDLKIQGFCLKLDEIQVELIEKIKADQIDEDINPIHHRYIHIFSNILDIEDYDQDHLSQLIKSKSLKGWHDCLIVSPIYGLKRLKYSSDQRVEEMIDRFRQLDSFQERLNKILKLEGSSDSLFKIFSFKID